MAQGGTLSKFMRNNSLSIVLFGLFFIFFLGLCASGYTNANHELVAHGQPKVSLPAYLGSGEFVEAVFENWESEFLQMGALVVLTIFLRQKGSADSKNIRGKQEVDAKSKYSIARAKDIHQMIRAIKHALYSNSLSIALFSLFILSFVIHVISGASAYNEEALLHGQPTITALAYATTAQFWFESFQNWQSEFLAVGALLVLSIFLRQRGSPESKRIGDPDYKTGE